MKWNSRSRWESRAIPHAHGLLARVDFKTFAKAACVGSASRCHCVFHRKLPVCTSRAISNIWGQCVFSCWEVEEEQEAFFQRKMRLFQVERFFLCTELIHFCTGSKIITYEKSRLKREKKFEFGPIY